MHDRMDVVRQQVSAEELLHIPDDGFRYERVCGECVDAVPGLEFAVGEIFE